MNKIKQFLIDARYELKKVNWPSREDTTKFTIFVIIFALAVAFFLGLLDYIFTSILSKIVA